MNQSVSRQHRMALRKANKKRPSRLTELPKSRWPDDQRPDGAGCVRLRVWVSRDYLVQEFEEGSGLRLSINRTEMLPNGRWDDGLSWDEMQNIKRQVGHGDCFAVEIYPPDRDMVNVANMRHLWIPVVCPDIGWKRG